MGARSWLQLPALAMLTAQPYVLTAARFLHVTYVVMWSGSFAIHEAAADRG